MELAWYKSHHLLHTRQYGGNFDFHYLFSRQIWSRRRDCLTKNWFAKGRTTVEGGSANLRMEILPSTILILLLYCFCCKEQTVDKPTALFLNLLQLRHLTSNLSFRLRSLLKQSNDLYSLHRVHFLTCFSIFKHWQQYFSPCFFLFLRQIVQTWSGFVLIFLGGFGLVGGFGLRFFKAKRCRATSNRQPRQMAFIKCSRHNSSPHLVQGTWYTWLSSVGAGRPVRSSMRMRYFDSFSVLGSNMDLGADLGGSNFG